MSSNDKLILKGESPQTVVVTSEDVGEAVVRMPQIKFVNYKDYLDEDGYRCHVFTIELMDNHPLVVGDLFQVCHMKAVLSNSDPNVGSVFRKMRLRSICAREIVEDDIGKRRIKIDSRNIRTYFGNGIEKYLFRNNVTHADNIMGDNYSGDYGNTLYIRISRPTHWTFSNEGRRLVDATVTTNVISLPYTYSRVRHTIVLK